MEFYGQHQEWITYYTYQFEPSCTFDCYESWDAYRWSLLGVGGGETYGGGALWYLPGVPAISTVTAQYDEQTLQVRGTYCWKPRYETSQYVGVEPPSSGFYGGEFSGHIDDYYGFANYSYRHVRESFSNISDTCWFSGSAYSPPGPGFFGSGSTWTVTGTTYQLDNLGVTVAYGNYYQNHLNPGQSCVAWTDTQKMEMDSCSSPYMAWSLYDSHTNTFTISKTSMYAARASAGGPAQ